jgi:hypothetical protein
MSQLLERILGHLKAPSQSGIRSVMNDNSAQISLLVALCKADKRLANEVTLLESFTLDETLANKTPPTLPPHMMHHPMFIESGVLCH